MIIIRLYYFIIGLALLVGGGEAFLNLTKSMAGKAAEAHQKGPISLKQFTEKLTGEHYNY